MFSFLPLPANQIFTVTKPESIWGESSNVWCHMPRFASRSLLIVVFWGVWVYWSKSGFDILQNIDIVSKKHRLLQSSKASKRLSYRGHESSFFLQIWLETSCSVQDKDEILCFEDTWEGSRLGRYVPYLGGWWVCTVSVGFWKVGDSVSPYHPSLSQFMKWDTMWIMKCGKFTLIYAYLAGILRGMTYNSWFVQPEI